MDDNGGDQQSRIETLVELYKVADENHRFYVDKRFAVLSLYFPLMTLILTGIYAVAAPKGPKPIRLSICFLGVALTLFLSMIESRNWHLSNVCLHRAADICADMKVRHNLHSELSKSYDDPLPEWATLFDRLVRVIGRSQHKAVLRLTIILLLYWIGLAVVVWQTC